MNNLLNKSILIERLLRQPEVLEAINSYGTMKAKNMYSNFRMWVALTGTDIDQWEKDIDNATVRIYENDIEIEITKDVYLGGSTERLTTIMFASAYNFQKSLAPYNVGVRDGDSVTVTVNDQKTDVDLAKAWIKEHADHVDLENYEIESIVELSTWK